VGEEKNAVVTYDELAGIGVVVGLVPYISQVIVAFAIRLAVGNRIAVEVCSCAKIHGYLFSMEIVGYR
jgi:hypothetical protein